MLAITPRLLATRVTSQSVLHTPWVLLSGARAFSRPQHVMASVANGRVNEGLHKPLNDVFTGLPTTIFTVMTNLAIKHQTINLGQGFPDEVTALMRCSEKT